MSFNNQQGEAPLFTDAIEAEIIELAEQRSDEGKQWFGRVMGIIGKGRKSDGEQFS
ncbi:capsid scaffolding [Enterobacter ludwigii]|nr:capsid scaffolding [Enterobacter ludwigii]SAH11435.1 capsid scaffolding [Enterobacter ludwigii]